MSDSRTILYRDLSWRVHSFIQLSKFVGLNVNDNRFYCKIKKKRNSLEWPLGCFKTRFDCLESIVLSWPSSNITSLMKCFPTHPFISVFIILAMFFFLQQTSVCLSHKRREHAESLLGVNLLSNLTHRTHLSICQNE